MLKLYIINSSPVLRELTRNVSNTSDVVGDEKPQPVPIVELPESGATLYNLTFIFTIDSILPYRLLTIAVGCART